MLFMFQSRQEHFADFFQFTRSRMCIVCPLFEALLGYFFKGTYKVRNEINENETKRNQQKRNEINEMKTK